MRISRLFALGTALFAAGSSLPAGAQILTTTADAHVTDNVRDTIPNHYNFGAMNYLLVQNDPARVYKAYLRFDLNPVAQAGQYGVRSATLHLNFSRFRDPQTPDLKENTFTVYGITDNVDAWTEGMERGANTSTDLMFDNAPHNDKTSATGLLDVGDKDGSAVRSLGTFTVARNTAPGTEFRVDMAPFVNWALRGGAYGAAPAGDTDKTVSLVLVHSAGNDMVPNNGVHFHSKENTAGAGGANLPASAPRLSYVVETTPTRVAGTVVSVVDAETVVVRGVGNVRLVGVSALRDPKRKPRRDDDLFGDDADRVARRLTAGHKVHIEFEGARNGVSLGWVFLENGALVNEEMIRKGYARLDPAAAESRYASRLRAAETEAKAAKRGLWPKQK